MSAGDVGDIRCDPQRGCVTCSDDGVLMHVLQADAEPGLAICVDGDGQQLEVMTGIVGDVTVGDTLLVHAGTALMRWARREEAAREIRRRVP